MSANSLLKIGLTPIEIRAIEQSNPASGGDKSFLITADGKPTGENNPFSKDKWNLEAQRKLSDNNPILARKLMIEAGVLKK